MTKKLLLLTVFILCSTLDALSWETHSYAPVRVGDGAAFLVTEDGNQSANDRADSITSKIDRVLQDPSLKPEDIFMEKDATGTYNIKLGAETIVTVTNNDATVFGESTQNLAKRWTTSIKEKTIRLEPLYRNSKSMDIKMLDEHQVLLLLIQVAVLLLGAFVLGEIVASLGQPAVIGQMLAGIILGKSVFGSIFPDLARVIFPVSTIQANLLEVVSWFGVIFLLMLTGLETDVELIKKQGRSCLGASILGIIVPFSTGFGFAYLIPDELLLNPNNRTIVALFIGTVFSVSSVPVIAKILMEMQLLRRNVAQIILATALVHDTVGCIILALVAALASAHSTLGPELLKAPVGCLVFVGAALLGRKYIFSLLRWVNDHIKSDEALITAVTVILLFSAAFTQYVGVHVVLGAFMVGFLLSQTPIVRKRVIHSFEIVTMGIFAPIFFAGAGLHVNLQLLADPRLLILTIVMSLLACGSKVSANFVGGRIGGLSKWESLCLGFGANAPGAMGLIVGILGYSMDIINVELLSVIIVMSLVTTAITPPLIKWTLRNVEIGEDEQDRLDKEEAKSKTHIGSINRVLLPCDRDQFEHTGTKILEALGQDHKIEATLLTVLSNHSDIEKNEDDSIVGIDIKNVTLVSRSTNADNESVSEIIEEAQKEYDLIVTCASSNNDNHRTTFDEQMDNLISNSPCPILIVNYKNENYINRSLSNILIPTTGADSSMKSLEMGLVIARGCGAKVTCMNVIEDSRQDETGSTIRLHGEDITKDANSLAEAFEVEMNTIVKSGETAADEILAIAKELNSDAIVLGGIRRPTSNLFMGQIVRKVVCDAECTVYVYIT